MFWDKLSFCESVAKLDLNKYNAFNYHKTSFDVNVIGLDIIVKLFLRCLRCSCNTNLGYMYEDLS